MNSNCNKNNYKSNCSNISLAQSLQSKLSNKKLSINNIHKSIANNKNNNNNSNNDNNISSYINNYNLTTNPISNSYDYNNLNLHNSNTHKHIINSIQNNYKTTNALNKFNRRKAIKVISNNNYTLVSKEENEDDIEIKKILTALKKDIKTPKEINILKNYLKNFQGLIKLFKDKVKQGETEEFIRLIAMYIKLEYFNKNDIIFRKADFGSKFYIIIKGKLSILMPSKKIYRINLYYYILHLFNLFILKEKYLFFSTLDENEETCYLSQDVIKFIIFKMAKATDYILSLSDSSYIDSNESSKFNSKRIDAINSLYNIRSSDYIINEKLNIDNCNLYSLFNIVNTNSFDDMIDKIIISDNEKYEEYINKLFAYNNNNESDNNTYNLSNSKNIILLSKLDINIFSINKENNNNNNNNDLANKTMFNFKINKENNILKETFISMDRTNEYFYSQIFKNCNYLNEHDNEDSNKHINITNKENTLIANRNLFYILVIIKSLKYINKLKNNKYGNTEYSYNNQPAYFKLDRVSCLSKLLKIKQNNFKRNSNIENNNKLKRLKSIIKDIYVSTSNNINNIKLNNGIKNISDSSLKYINDINNNCYTNKKSTDSYNKNNMCIYNDNKHIITNKVRQKSMMTLNTTNDIKETIIKRYTQTSMMSTSFFNKIKHKSLVIKKVITNNKQKEYNSDSSIKSNKLSNLDNKFEDLNNKNITNNNLSNDSLKHVDINSNSNSETNNLSNNEDKANTIINYKNNDTITNNDNSLIIKNKDINSIKSNTFNNNINNYYENKEYLILLYSSFISNIYQYKFLKTLTDGSEFGDIALVTEKKERTATIISNSNCYLGIINKEIFDKSLKHHSKNIVTEEINNLISFDILSTINKKLFEEKIYGEFSIKKPSIDDFIIKQNEEVSNIYFISNGQFELSIKITLSELEKLLVIYNTLDDDIIHEDITNSNNKINNTETMITSKVDSNLNSISNNSYLNHLSNMMNKDNNKSNYYKKDNDYYYKKGLDLKETLLKNITQFKEFYNKEVFEIRLKVISGNDIIGLFDYSNLKLINLEYLYNLKNLNFKKLYDYLEDNINKQIEVNNNKHYNNYNMSNDKINNIYNLKSEKSNLIDYKAKKSYVNLSSINTNKKHNLDLNYIYRKNTSLLKQNINKDPNQFNYKASNTLVNKNSSSNKLKFQSLLISYLSQSFKSNFSLKCISINEKTNIHYIDKKTILKQIGLEALIKSSTYTINKRNVIYTRLSEVYYTELMFYMNKNKKSIDIDMDIKNNYNFNKKSKFDLEFDLNNKSTYKLLFNNNKCNLDSKFNKNQLDKLDNNNKQYSIGSFNKNISNNINKNDLNNIAFNKKKYTTKNLTSNTNDCKNYLLRNNLTNLFNRYFLIEFRYITVLNKHINLNNILNSLIKYKRLYRSKSFNSTIDLNRSNINNADLNQLFNEKHFLNKVMHVLNIDVINCNKFKNRNLIEIIKKSLIKSNMHLNNVYNDNSRKIDKSLRKSNIEVNVLNNLIINEFKTNKTVINENSVNNKNTSKYMCSNISNNKFLTTKYLETNNMYDINIGNTKRNTTLKSLSITYQKSNLLCLKNNSNKSKKNNNKNIKNKDKVNNINICSIDKKSTINDNTSNYSNDINNIKNNIDINSTLSNLNNKINNQQLCFNIDLIKYNWISRLINKTYILSILEYSIFKKYKLNNKLEYELIEKIALKTSKTSTYIKKSKSCNYNSCNNKSISQLILQKMINYIIQSIDNYIDNKKKNNNNSIVTILLNENPFDKSYINNNNSSKKLNYNIKSKKNIFNKTKYLSKFKKINSVYNSKISNHSYENNLINSNCNNSPFINQDIAYNNTNINKINKIKKSNSTIINKQEFIKNNALFNMSDNNNSFLFLFNPNKIKSNSDITSYSSIENNNCKYNISPIKYRKYLKTKSNILYNDKTFSKIKNHNLMKMSNYSININVSNNYKNTNNVSLNTNNSLKHINNNDNDSFTNNYIKSNENKLNTSKLKKNSFLNKIFNIKKTNFKEAKSEDNSIIKNINIKNNVLSNIINPNQIFKKFFSSVCKKKVEAKKEAKTEVINKLHNSKIKKFECLIDNKLKNKNSIYNKLDYKNLINNFDSCVTDLIVKSSTDYKFKEVVIDKIINYKNDINSNIEKNVINKDLYNNENENSSIHLFPMYIISNSNNKIKQKAIKYTELNSNQCNKVNTYKTFYLKTIKKNRSNNKLLIQKIKDDTITNMNDIKINKNNNKLLCPNKDISQDTKYVISNSLNTCNVKNYNNNNNKLYNVINSTSINKLFDKLKPIYNIKSKNINKSKKLKKNETIGINKKHVPNSVNFNCYKNDIFKFNDIKLI